MKSIIRVSQFIHSVGEKYISIHHIHYTPSISPPHPEPLCWLHALEGGGRYLYDLQMKPNEGECAHPNATISENLQVKRRRRDYSKINSKINSQTYISTHKHTRTCKHS